MNPLAEISDERLAAMIRAARRANSEWHTDLPFAQCLAAMFAMWLEEDPEEAEKHRDEIAAAAGRMAAWVERNHSAGDGA